MFSFGANVPTAVSESKDLLRIRSLPWHTQDLNTDLVARMQACLAKSGCTYQMRPHQAEALAQLARLGGLFAPIPPGCGKTLISILAPAVLHMRGDGAGDRALLIVPAATVPKTMEAVAFLSTQYHLRPFRIISYQQLSMAKYANLLKDYQPTAIILDEAQNLKNSAGARWRRLKRYDATCRQPPIYAAMSGSFTSRKMSEMRHIAARCLRGLSPVPQDPNEGYLWGLALDSKTPYNVDRPDPGALLTIAPAHESDADITAGDDLELARHRVGRRIRHSLGVVAYGEGLPDVELHITTEEIPPPSAISTISETMSDTWELPTGDRITDALALARHQRQLALGYTQQWREPGPPEWMAARREWHEFVREVISHSHTLDTPAQVTERVANGTLPRGASLLVRWREVEATFTPDPYDAWVSDYRLLHAAEWLAKHPRGIVWTAYIPFGRRLATLTKLPYFPDAGRIDTHTGPCIASIDSCGTGLDLQHRHSDNYIASCPTMGGRMEQLLARTHRDGQKQRKVTARIILSLPSEHAALQQCLEDAKMAQRTLQSPQRLLLSSI